MPLHHIDLNKMEKWRSHQSINTQLCFLSSMTIKGWCPHQTNSMNQCLESIMHFMRMLCRVYLVHVQVCMEMCWYQAVLADRQLCGLVLIESWRLGLIIDSHCGVSCLCLPLVCNSWRQRVMSLNPIKPAVNRMVKRNTPDMLCISSWIDLSMSDC